MSVIVVATVTPVDGRVQEIVDAYARIASDVHAEPGCEFYAVHRDAEVVIIVERWTTRADLDAHAAGAPVARLGQLVDGLLARPIEVRVLQGVPLGDQGKGAIPA